MSMNRATTSKRAITPDDLRRLAEERRLDGERASLPTSVEAVDVFAVVERVCACGERYEAARTRTGFRPDRCPACRPASVEPAEPAGAVRARQGRDVLDQLHAAGVNVAKYKGATLSTFDATHDPEALKAARAYVEAWDSDAGPYPARDWMYLYGTGSSRTGRDVEIGAMGNGKTFLAVAIARELLERGSLRPDRFVFATAETILLESEATFRSNSDDSEKQLLQRYERPDLLIIDDLGVRHDPTPHAIRLFDELTKRRECRATIWTSNLSLKVLHEGASSLGRITTRIAGECGDGARYVVEFRGPNRRIERSRMARRAS